MATITLFIEEIDDAEERRRRTRRRRAAALFVAAIAAALAFARESETKPETKPKVIVRDRVVLVKKVEYFGAIGPMKPTIDAVPRAERPFEPVVLLVHRPVGPAWPELPDLTRVVTTASDSHPSDSHHCSLAPLVEPRTIHFRAPGRQRVTISNPHDVAVEVERIDLAGGGDPVRGYVLENAPPCLGTLEPAERCAFIVRATTAAAYTPAVRVAIGHATRR